jgi:intraflagellar transport protein 46
VSFRKKRKKGGIMSSSDDDFSDSGLFEDSEEKDTLGDLKEKETEIFNKPYDEAFEVSADFSVNSHQMGELADMKQGPGNAAMNEKGQNALMDENKAPSQYKHAPSTDDKRTTFQNRPYDEQFELSGSDSDSSIETTDGKGALVAKDVESKQDPFSTTTRLSQEVSESKEGRVPRESSGLEKMAENRFSFNETQHETEPESSDDDEDDDEDDDDEDDDDDSSEGSAKLIPGAYNPREYDHLNVGPEIRELFQHIERFQPHDIELDTTLQCFIPDYIPTVGEMFNSLTVPPPSPSYWEEGKEQSEGKEASKVQEAAVGSEFGLKVLAEPSTKQSDPTVLELQLRALSKKSHGEITVRSIDDAQNNPRLIDQWIENVEELHRTKPQTQIHYHYPMPDIETLMDVWPEEVEDALNKIPLPDTAELDISLTEQLDLICSFLDIPIHETKRVESLHLLFSLFLEFKNNPHFGGSEEYMTQANHS